MQRGVFITPLVQVTLPQGILNYLPEREKVNETGVNSWMSAKQAKPIGFTFLTLSV